MTSASFNVIIINDSVFERTEEFRLTFFRDTLPINVIGVNEATVMIIDDDDGKYVWVICNS